MLLDIGAGLGMFTLAAAARGHRVIAMEASPNSTEALLESIRYNGWQKRITLHHSPAGAVDRRPVCLERGGVHNTDLARGYATAEVALSTIYAFHHKTNRLAPHCSSVQFRRGFLFATVLRGWKHLCSNEPVTLQFQKRICDADSQSETQHALSFW